MMARLPITEKPDGKRWKWKKIFFWSVAAVLLYVGSSAPAWVLAFRSGNDAAIVAYGRIYWPWIFVTEHSHVATDIHYRQIHLWASMIDALLARFGEPTE